MLFSVTGTLRGKPFTAGFGVASGGVVAEAAPILRRLFMGKRIEYVLGYCDGMRWKIERVLDSTQ